MRVPVAFSILIPIALFSSSVSAATRAENVELVIKGPPQKTVKGEVVRENLKGIDLKSDGSPAFFKWTQVDSVGGRPVLEHVESLKAKLKDVLCPDCKGGLIRVLCAECLGTGTFLRLTRLCDKCNKTGTNGVPCKAKGCENGKVACTGKCLKHDSPHVFMWRTSETRIHTRGYTDNHLGEVFEFKEVKPFAPAPGCQKCKGAGKEPCSECRKYANYAEAEPKSLGKCKICEGSPAGPGSLTCSICQGLGAMPCETCLGSKVVPDPGSAMNCPHCKGGELRCMTCSQTGLIDPLSPPRTPANEERLTPWRGEVRKALAALGEKKLTKADRITFRDGRSIEGTVLLKMPTGIVLGIPADSEEDPKVLAVLNRHVFRLEGAKDRPSGTEPTSAPSPVPADAKPSSGSDTVTLKDGSVLKGKILIKSEKLLLIETADGKRVRVEMENVADVRTDPKVPK